MHQLAARFRLAFARDLCGLCKLEGASYSLSRIRGLSILISRDILARFHLAQSGWLGLRFERVGCLGRILIIVKMLKRLILNLGFTEALGGQIWSTPNGRGVNRLASLMDSVLGEGLLGGLLTGLSGLLELLSSLKEGLRLLD